MKKLLVTAIAVVLLFGGLVMPTTAATEYTEHFFIFVKAEKLNTANNFAAQWDPDTGGADTFGTVRLSADGTEPASHYATSTRATPTMRDGITQALSDVSWAWMYRTDDILAESPHWYSNDADWTYDGDLYDAWLSALDDMGLQRIPAGGI